MEQNVSFPRRYRGPLTSANGGYASGTLASFLDAGASEVTLRLPPPLERALVVRERNGGVVLLDGDDVVAEARGGAALAVDAPEVTPEEAVAASAVHVRLGNAAFSECFSCGIRRERDGLEIHPGPVPRREPLHAAPWIAREVDPAVVWAAIDCCGAYALRGLGRGDSVLGRMTARIERLPEEREPCVVVGWRLEEDGRKLHAATAMLGADGEPLVVARQVWIAPRSAQVGNPRARIPDAQDP